MVAHPLGDSGPEGHRQPPPGVPGSEHDELHLQLPGARHDGFHRLLLGCVQHFTRCFDARGNQLRYRLVDQLSGLSTDSDVCGRHTSYRYTG